jgi:O-antigen/teichoic acid export membrane protein
MVGSLNKDNSDGDSSAAAPKSPSMIKNFLNLFSGRFIGDLGTFLLFVVLSRKFGEEGIGQYSFATVVGGLALIFADFGLRSYTLKEVGRHRQAAKDRYSEIVATTLTNTAITLACFILVVLIAPITGEAKWIFALIGISQLFLGILGCFGVLFIAHERMDIGAFYETRASWLVALSAVTVALSGGNLIAVCATIAVAYLVAAIVGATFAIRHFQISLGHFSLKIYRLRLLEALPFALRQILRQVSMRMDILFIGFLLGASQVGAYAVAYRLIYMLFLMFNLVGIAILPASSRNFKESREDFVFLAQRAMGVAVLLSVPAAVGLVLVAPAAIELIFSSEFESSAGLLQALAVLVAIFPLAVVTLNLLDASDRQIQTMTAEAVGVVIGLIAHSVLIPVFGLYGAVAAAIITEFAVLGSAIYAFRDFISWPKLGSRLAIAAFGSAAFALLFLALPGVSVFLLMPLAVVIYAGIVACFRNLREEELGALIQLVRGRRA